MVSARRVKYLFLIVPVLVAGLTTWYLGLPGRGGDEDEGESVPRLLLKPGEAHVVKLDLAEHAQGRTQWRLVAPQARRGADGGIRIVEPRLTLFREEGEPLWLSAGEGLVNEESRRMRFQNHVVATTTLADGHEARITAQAGEVDGRSRAMRFLDGVAARTRDGLLTAPELHYDADNRAVSTSRAFLFEGQEITLEGEGMRLTLPDQRLLVEGGVKARFGPGKKGTP